MRFLSLIAVALFVPLAVGYSAEPNSMVSEGYEARDYAQARMLHDQVCMAGDVWCTHLDIMFAEGERWRQ